VSARGWTRRGLGRLREAMAGHVERGEVPGLVFLVSRGGETQVEALGHRAIGGPPMSRDTLFRIASLTKPVAAAAAMILVEECRLRLDDPVDRLLPELADRRVLRRIDGPVEDTVPARRPLTLRDLLTLRMGLGYVMDAPGPTPIQRMLSEYRVPVGPPRPQAWPEPDEWMRRIGTLPMMHQPGERWMYDVGSDVLGVLIARAAGQSLETFLGERLFGPLGMKDTGFGAPADQVGRLATSYWTDPGTGARAVYDPAEDGEWSRPPAFPAAASGLVSTVDDYLAFGQMLLVCRDFWTSAYQAIAD
jgi:CubicO group peptidase (beta-lactamase class C family)